MISIKKPDEKSSGFFICFSAINPYHSKLPSYSLRSPVNLPNDIKADTLEWVEKVVIGLNLCPFAAPVFKKSLTCEISPISKKSTFDEAMTESLQWFLQELDAFQQADENVVSTTLLIFPHNLEDFENFLDFLDIVNSCIDESGLRGMIQLASFHPQYCFDGVEANDPSNLTNRSPLPTLHLIREEHIARALAGYKHPEQIPERNQERLTTLGFSGLYQMMPIMKEYLEPASNNE
jgi:hypothetical protein